VGFRHGRLVLELPGRESQRNQRAYTGQLGKKAEVAARVAQDAGAKLALLNAKLGTITGPEAYLVTTEANVTALTQALR